MSASCLAVYFFEKYDVVNSLPYGDETFTIILNTTCPKEKVPAELRDFFDYVSDQEIAKGDPFIEHIHYMVEELNGRKEIEQIMTLEEELDVRYKLGKKEGREESAKDAARKMKAKGFDETEIAEITGLSVEQVREL